MVFEAVREDIGSRAAVKVLRPGRRRTPDRHRFFQRSARRQHLVRHPGSSGSSTTAACVRRRLSGDGYLEGESLARIKQLGGMSIDDAVVWDGR